jgi:glyoxylase-like metal-dependent hydrolase (beta-lactamase superfamily II)
MIKVHHINSGQLRGFPNDSAPMSIVHCLVIQEGDRLVLVDSGFGLAEMRRPLELLGKEAIEFWGIETDERFTITRELERLGLNPAQVTDIVLTHGDVDHAGGLADFPKASVHVSEEEAAVIRGGNPRYVARQFAHGPRFKTYGASTQKWQGLEARPVDAGLSSPVYLVPLFGHTVGHCGVAVQGEDGWFLHAGDSYYRRVEVDSPSHPVAAMAKNFAADDAARLRSLELLRGLKKQAGAKVTVLSAHDYTEYPGNPPNVRPSNAARE